MDYDLFTNPFDEESDGDDKPSTVDIGAIKDSIVTTLSTNYSLTPLDSQMWRGAASHLRHELPRKDPLPNGHDEPASDGSDEDSDSNSSSSSGSSSEEEDKEKSVTLKESLTARRRLSNPRCLNLKVPSLNYPLQAETPPKEIPNENPPLKKIPNKEKSRWGGVNGTVKATENRRLRTRSTHDLDSIDSVLIAKAKRNADLTIVPIPGPKVSLDVKWDEVGGKSPPRQLSKLSIFNVKKDRLRAKTEPVKVNDTKKKIVNEKPPQVLTSTIKTQRGGKKNKLRPPHSCLNESQLTNICDSILKISLNPKRGEERRPAVPFKDFTVINYPVDGCDHPMQLLSQPETDVPANKRKKRRGSSLPNDNNALNRSLPLKKRHHAATPPSKPNQAPVFVFSQATLEKKVILGPTKVSGPFSPSTIEKKMPVCSFSSLDNVENGVKEKVVPKLTITVIRGPKGQKRKRVSDASPSKVEELKGRTKRKKVNRTGFPNPKKKRRMIPKPIEVVDLVDDDPEFSERLEQAVKKSKKPVQEQEQEYALTASERVKVLRRSSIEGLLEGLIMPIKKNFLQAGLESTRYKGEITNVRRPKEKFCLALPQNAWPSCTGIGFLLPFDIWVGGKLAEEEAKRIEDEKKIAELAAEKDKKVAEKKLEKTLQGKKRRKGIPPNAPMPAEIPLSWNFKKLRTNQYLNGRIKQNQEEVGDSECNCKVEDGVKCATDSCLNRLVMQECSASCGELCQNRRISSHSWLRVKRVMTELKGWGVFTPEPISKGAFILEYVGEVVPWEVFKERMRGEYSEDKHHYCLHLDGGSVIDGHRAGGEGRFVNHSCDPNCAMQKWSVGGLNRMALFALRDIAIGEELSYHYNFQVFNPTEGQSCHCGAATCQGVIGGRSKAVKATAETPNGGGKKLDRRGKSGKRRGKDEEEGRPEKPEMRPLGKKDRLIVARGRCFLIRNRERRFKLNKEDIGIYSDRMEKLLTPYVSRWKGGVETGELQIPDDDPKFTRNVKIALVLHKLFIALTQARDEKGGLLCAPFLGKRRKKKTEKDFDLSNVGRKILRGGYKNLSLLEADITSVFSSMAFDDETRKLQAKLLKILTDVREEAVSSLSQLVFRPSLPPFQPPAHVADSIRCICGTFFEEGGMVQCDKCLVWQHTECVRWNLDEERKKEEVEMKKELGSPKKEISPKKEMMTPKKGISPKKEIITPKKEPLTPVGDVVVKIENVLVGVHEQIRLLPKEGEDAFLCERCSPRVFDLEVPTGKPMLVGNDDDEKQTYLTLQREDGFLVRRFDTVYVLRDIPPEKKVGGVYNYLTAGPLVPSTCDIFRVESLWKDKEGKRFVLGYHYLRPFETFHEPSRRFFPQEIVKSPHSEIVPIDLVSGRCFVLDPKTFSKGRPIGADDEDHVYICEFRVDKTARCFSKIKQNSQAVSMKPFAFRYFVTTLKIARNVHPHGPPQHVIDNVQDGKKPGVKHKEKRERLNNLGLQLLSRIEKPGDTREDASYLVKGMNKRRKTMPNEPPLVDITENI